MLIYPFVSKSHEHRFNAVLTAFSKNRECPLTQVKNFRIKLGFICTFNLCVGFALQQKKLRSEFKKFANAHLHFHLKTKKLDYYYTQLVELPQCAFLKLLKF